MSCRRCGTQTPNDYCQMCSVERKYEHLAADLAGDGDGGKDDGTDNGGESMYEYECTQCGTRYQTEGSSGCPDCGSHRRRYVGPLRGDN